MCSRFLSYFSIALLSIATRASAIENGVFRVCADPNNLPFSNQAQQGFENRLASLVAADLGAKLEYSWWSERKSFLKNSLAAGACDAVMGVPAEVDTFAVTRPYYRSTYVFLSRHDRNLDIHSLNADQLDTCRIGIHVVGDDYAPPSQVLARRGLAANIVPFSLFGADGVENPPAKLIDAVKHGDVDVAIVWGPFAGFFAQHSEPSLDVVPVSPASFLGIPFTYPVAIAVRKQDTSLRDRIDEILARRHDEVNRLLETYGVPLVREVGQ